MIGNLRAQKFVSRPRRPALVLRKGTNFQEFLTTTLIFTRHVCGRPHMFVAHVNTASGLKMIAVGFATVLAIIFAHESANVCSIFG